MGLADTRRNYWTLTYDRIVAEGFLERYAVYFADYNWSNDDAQSHEYARKCVQRFVAAQTGKSEPASYGKPDVGPVPHFIQAERLASAERVRETVYTAELAKFTPPVYDSEYGAAWGRACNAYDDYLRRISGVS